LPHHSLIRGRGSRLWNGYFLTGPDILIIPAKMLAIGGACGEARIYELKGAELY